MTKAEGSGRGDPEAPTAASFWPLALFIALILHAPPALQGSEALDARHSLPNLSVSCKGQTESVWILPSFFSPEKWHYATARLHFRQQTVQGQQAPEMTLVRYQREDPAKPNTYLEGATLHIAVDIDPLDPGAKNTLLGEARKAAETWETGYFQMLSAFLQQAAGTEGPQQAAWKAVSDAYPGARNQDMASKKTDRVDALVEQALNDGLPSEAAEGLRESSRLLRMRNPASLAALPIATAALSLYDGTGRAAQTAAPATGVAPELATASLPFTLGLDRNAADICDSLLTSQTGIFFLLQRDFEILSDPLPCAVTIDYDKGLRELSGNETLRRQAYRFAHYPLEAPADAERKSLCQTLAQKGILTTAVGPGGAAPPLESLDETTLRPLVGRLCRGLFQPLAAPESVNMSAVKSSRAERPVGDGDFPIPPVRPAGKGSAPEAPADRPATFVQELAPDAPARSGAETLPAGYRYRERNAVTSQGFLNLQKNSQAVRDKLVFDEKAAEWENAYFLLPSVGNDALVAVRTVSAEVGLEIGGERWQQQSATWSVAEGWLLGGKEKPDAFGILSFPLPEARQKFGEAALKTSEFVIAQSITCGASSLQTLPMEYRVKVFDGRSMVATPIECIELMIFDLSNVTWRQPGMALYRASFQVTQRLGKLSPLTMTQNLTSGREILFVPLLKNPLLGTDVGSVVPVLSFATKTRQNGKPVSAMIQWNLNNKDLMQSYPSLFVPLFNQDWRAP